MNPIRQPRLELGHSAEQPRDPGLLRAPLDTTSGPAPHRSPALTQDLKRTATARVRCTAHAQVTGGRDGSAKTTDSGLDVNLRGPPQVSGADGGTNPEELLAAGYAA